MRDMEKPESARTILERALKDLEIDAPLKAYSVFSAWKEIVGESIASQSQPCLIRNKILFVEVSHSTWIQQLQFLKPKLLENIRDFLGESLIEDIRFRLGKVTPLPSNNKNHEAIKDIKIDKKTLDQIEELLKKIDDEEIKRLLRNIFMNVARLKFHRER